MIIFNNNFECFNNNYYSIECFHIKRTSNLGKEDRNETSLYPICYYFKIDNKSEF